MVSSDKFNLKWNDFQLNIKDIFKNVRKEENLFDVTLICEDEIWKAHNLFWLHPVISLEIFLENVTWKIL